MASPTQTVVGKDTPNLLIAEGFAKNPKGLSPILSSKIPYQVSPTES